MNGSSFLKSFIWFLVLTVLIAFADWMFMSRPCIGIDDANIFLNYARHLSNGEGFVFNTGGERVEGFTSMLWVLICACFYKLSSSPEWLIIFFLLLITAYTITLVYRELCRDIQQFDGLVSEKAFMIIYTGFIVAVGPSYIAWSVLTLMENALWNLLFTVTVIMVLRGFRKITILPAEKAVLLITGILMILTRPEALAWVLIFTALLVIAGIRNRSGFIFPAVYLLLTAVTAFILVRFRLAYFGYPLPNTYYAKVSGNRMYNIMNGLEYAYGFVVTYNPVITFLLIMLLMVSVFALVKKQLAGKLLRLQDDGNLFLIRNAIVSFLIVTAIFLVCVTGGDHFGAFRFYQVIILLLAWALPALVWAWKEFGSASVNGFRLYLLAGTAAFIAITGANSLFSVKKTAHTQIKNEFVLAINGRQLASELNACWPKVKPSAGVIAVGGFGLAYKGETVDIMGLNNTLMGHSKGDRIGIKNHAAFNKEVFYQLHPDLLLPAMVPDSASATLIYLQMTAKGNLENQTLKNILTDPEFIKTYLPVTITGAAGKVNLFSFVNKDALEKMEKDPALAINRLK